MSRIETYKYEDSISNVKGLILINSLLLFCLIVTGVNVDVHEIILGVQIAILLVAWNSFNLKSKNTVIALFIFYFLSTIYEAFIWTLSLDGIIRGGESGKGAPFAFVLQSPPYFYPLIRIGSITLFVHIFATFRLKVCK
jgi:hypothetical protein